VLPASLPCDLGENGDALEALLSFDEGREENEKEKEKEKGERACQARGGSVVVSRDRGIF
jgi:hypothetical protein